jgi:hypothetical protein
VRTDAQIFCDAVETVEPSPERVNECRDWIQSDIVVVRRIPRKLLSPAAMRDRLFAYANMVREVKRETKILETFGWVGLVDFVAMLEGQILQAEKFASNLAIPAGGELPNLIGQVAAFLARQALCRFERAVTTTITKEAENRWFRLTSLYYEAATAEEEKDLSRQCRQVDEPRFFYANFQRWGPACPWPRDTQAG